MRDIAVKVLVVTSALVPEQLGTWAAAADEDGVELHIAGALVHDRSESYLADLAVPEFGTTHVLEPTGWIAHGRLWWRLEGLEELVAELQPDVIHVHSEVWGRLVAQALRTGRPVIAHGAENVSLVHGSRLEALIRRTLSRRNARRLAGYASWNPEGVAILRANGLRSGSPTAVAPAIVPAPEPYLVAGESRLPHDGPVRVGYVGRLVPEKGVHWLIGALETVEGARLVVVGSGPYESHLRGLAERRGVDAEFLGSLPPERVPDAVAGMDVVVVPSLTRPGWAEQFGRVVCEAMLAGVPVITSDSGSLPHVVGSGGIVVPELDHGALREALDELVSSPDRRVELGKLGKEWALAHLVPQAAARDLVAMWREVQARA